MLLVVVLLGFFCLLGLAAHRFGINVRWLLLAGIAALVIFDLASRALP